VEALAAAGAVTLNSGTKPKTAVTAAAVVVRRLRFDLNRSSISPSAGNQVMIVAPVPSPPVDLIWLSRDNPSRILSA
jgi:hypothetical protein